MAAWIGINSTHLHSNCGHTDVYPLDTALNGDNIWLHNVNENHWFILDLGTSISVTKIRFRSYSTDDPTVVD